MKLNELPVSIQKQINETYESSDEILTKIKKKIGENINCERLKIRQKTWF